MCRAVAPSSLLIRTLDAPSSTSMSSTLDSPRSAARCSYRQHAHNHYDTAQKRERLIRDTSAQDARNNNKKVKRLKVDAQNLNQTQKEMHGFLF
jgi:hypothetical protein